MLLNRAHVYALRPTVEQAARLAAWAGATRCAYNLALEQRLKWHRKNWLERRFNFASQCRELTQLRAEFDWMRDVPISALQQALRDLEKAFTNWWSGRAGAPSPRKRGLNDAMRFTESFAFRRLSKHVGEVKLPKLGWVRMRWDKALPGGAVVKSVTVRHEVGQWVVSAAYEMEQAEPAPSALPLVGIDRGVDVFAALSDGVFCDGPNVGRQAAKSLARAQRALVRKQRGSNNRLKARRKVERLHARIRRARLDFLHKASTAVAKSHGTVVLEKLQVKNMTASARGTLDEPGRRVRQKAGLNRSILDQGWGMFATFLRYKLAQRGGELVEVNPAYSSQTCAECGHVAAASRRGSTFCCVSCGHEAHADTNAARVILQRGIAVLNARGMDKAPLSLEARRAVERGTVPNHSAPRAA